MATKTDKEITTTKRSRAKKATDPFETVVEVAAIKKTASRKAASKTEIVAEEKKEKKPKKGYFL